MVEVLSAYPARPPTPPKTSSHAFLDGEVNQGQHRGLLDTPDESPATNDLINLRSNSRSKKVNFSPWTNYIKPPMFSQSTSTSASNTNIRALPPSNECKPSKSILKATNSTVLPVSSNETPQNSESFAMLLESATQQLAGESLSSRLDAYMHLLGALKAYEGVPEEQAMIGKLGLLTQFIQRDICRDLEKGGPLETNLVIHALKFAIFLVWNQELSAQLSEDFRHFIVDQSLTSLQNAKAPKSVLNHYMHVLSTQNFPAKIMTNSKQLRILSVLSDVTDRVNGNGIVSQRLSVYQRVLTQSKTTMVSQSPLWLEHLISGLLHHLKDTRSKAIALGFQVTLALGPNAMVSTTLRDIFNKELDQGRKLVSEICERMSRMMSSTESGVHVPQIWSIIVLLLRSKRFNIEQWDHFKEWVLVMQRCFNCSEPTIKAQAILGWNRFVYAISTGESTSHSIVRMLPKPILSQFERKKNDKLGAATSQLVLSSYYNLIYYAFRPSTLYQHLDIIWEEYITQPFGSIFAPNPNLNERACRTLSFLLWSAQPKVWTENKANESSKMEPEHLPSVDCKWVRSRIASVLQVFEILFKSSQWTRAAIDESDIAIAWMNLSKTLSDASSKEIQPSVELMHAIASIIGLLQRLWNEAPSSLNAHSTDEFLGRFRFLSTSVISIIGPMPFTEKLLLKTTQATFQTTNTPTNRRSITDINLDTPFMHLLRLISFSPNLSESSLSYMILIDSLLESASKGRLSRGSRLDFFDKCVDINLTEMEVQPSSHAVFSRYIWEAAAKLAEDCLHSFPMETVRDRDGSVSRDYDNVLKILVCGLRFSDTHVKWSLLLDAIVRVVRIERGGRGIAKLIVEPLSEALKSLSLEQVCPPLRALIGQALSLPYYQQNRSIPRPVSCSLGSPAPDQTLFPHKLLDVVDKVLSEYYLNFKHYENTSITGAIESLTSLLGSGVLAFRHAVMERLQCPLALWLRDDGRQLTLDNGADNRMMTAYRSLSLAIANVLQTAVPHDVANVYKLETIISAGLESVHRSTANRFIEMWNTTFGLQDSLTYPPTVLGALRKLEPYVELQLPSPLPLEGEAQDDQVVHNFVNSQDGDNHNAIQELPEKNGDRNIFEKQLKDSRPAALSSSPIIPATDILPNRRVNLTPERRLRHDDSQIQFITVESFPSLESGPDSQLLTDRQREIKERQRNETPIFLDGLRSSSPGLPSPIKHGGIRTPVHLPDLRHSDPVSEIPLTPTLAAALQENDDEMPASSPTPGAKNRTQLDESKVPPLSIQGFETCESDPPSSPPELRPRSPRRGKVTRRTTLQKAESVQESSDGPAKENHPLCDPIDLFGAVAASENKSARTNENDDVSKQPENAAPSTSESPQKTQNVESGPGDVSSVISSDDVEQQIASQLEQDLELAVDLDEIQKKQPDPQSVLLTRKRKREATAELVSTPDQSKRRSLRNSAAIAKEKVKEQFQNSKTSGNPQPTSRVDKLLTPSTSPSKKSKLSFENDHVVESGSKRKSHRMYDGADTADAQSSTNSGNPSQKKRRSLRLSGVAASPPPEDDPVSRTPRTRRDRTEATELSQNAVIAPGEPITSQDQDLLTENEPHDSSRKSETQAPEYLDLAKGIVATVAHEFPDNDANTEEHNFASQSGIDCRFLMKDQDAVAPQEVSDEASTSICVSQGVQTDDALDKHEVTGGGILDSLRRIYDDMKNATFGKDVLRQLDDLMFHIRCEAHEAVRRDGN